MHHPTEILPTQMIETLRQRAFETEQLKSLPNETLDLIYQERWFQVLVPKKSGGLEYTLPQAVQLFEALAYADANVGWCVNLGAGANMFSGYLNEEVSKDIFNHSGTCCAGSGAVNGKATKTDGGYKLTGRWKYASGANHATHFTANALLLDESGAVVIEDGQPMFRSFIVPESNVTNYKNWEAIGLKATSSNDFEITDVFVKDEFVFDLKNPSGFADGTVYQFPFSLLAEINMTCMITGIALHFMESYESLAKFKKPLHSSIYLAENDVAKTIFENSSANFLNTRKSMYDLLNKVWICYEVKEIPDEELVLKFRKSVNEAAKLSRQLIYELFPLCGLNIVSEQNEMNKIWRDAAVAGQHYLLSPLYQIN
jgi:indole-3-acetate monooxygenase